MVGLLHTKHKRARLLYFASCEKLTEKLIADISFRKENLCTVLTEFAAEDGTYFDFICKSRFADELSDASDSEKELSSLVNGILDDLTALAPTDELKRRWYAYYGSKMTAKLFAPSKK